jgi:ubiquitin carboxyl-terminal hydrolase 36/42
MRVADAELSEADGAHGDFFEDDISALLTADTQVLSWRIEFVRARRPSQAPAASTSVRILNPEHEGLTGLAADDGQGELPGGASRVPGGLPPQRAPDLLASERLLGLLEWSTVRGSGPGLSNLGNTCFLNVILQVRPRRHIRPVDAAAGHSPWLTPCSPCHALPQALAYLPPVANLCASGSHSRTCRAIGFCASCELEALVRQMHTSSARVLSPTAIAQKIRLIGRHLQPGRQHDPHDFFLCLVDKLMAASPAGVKGEARNAWNGNGRDASLAGSGRLRGKPPPSAPAGANGGAAASPVLAPPDLGFLFSGCLASTVKCLSCSHACTTLEPCVDLSLAIHKSPTVHTALGLFTSPERLAVENQYQCPECAALADATKTIRVQSAPPVLVLHLKRFRYSRCAAPVAPGAN